MRRTPRTPRSLLLVPLLVALAACGGGGDDGDQDAFCDVAEEVGNDEPSDRELQELEDTAPEEIRDAVEIVISFTRAVEDDDADALEDLDDSDVEDAFADIEDFLTDECGIDLDEEEPEEEEAGGLEEFCGLSEDLLQSDDATTEDLEALLDAAPAEIQDDVEALLEFSRARDEDGDSAIDDVDIEALTEAGENVQAFAVEECGFEDPNPDEPTDDPAGDPEDVPDARPAPELDDPTEAELAAECEDGDLASCDRLFAVTEVGSPGEDYGSTCGGRVPLAEELRGGCVQFFGGDGGGDAGAPDLGGAQTPPASDDPAFAALGERCFDGDMAACDELFRTTPVDSPEEAYGETCGGRLSAAEAIPNGCEATFGAEVD